MRQPREADQMYFWTQRKAPIEGVGCYAKPDEALRSNKELLERAALAAGEMQAHKTKNEQSFTVSRAAGSYIRFHYLSISRGGEAYERRHHRRVIGFEFRNVSLV